MLVNVSKVICLWESLKIQNMSWDWCFHFTEIGPFWDLVSKKFHNHSVIIHLWRLRRCIIAEISKIHWKSMIKKHQYCFANISATKAQIFMKFYVVVNYYLVIICIKFHPDLCINARIEVVNRYCRDICKTILVFFILFSKLNLKMALYQWNENSSPISYFVF